MTGGKAVAAPDRRVLEQARRNERRDAVPFLPDQQQQRRRAKRQQSENFRQRAGANVLDLRERENDISLLAQSFLNRFAAQVPKKGLAFDRDAIRAINAHQWPGNVRELENSVRRAVIMAEGKHLTAKDLGLTSGVTGNVATLKSAREALEREFIQRGLRKHAGKITAAATDLGVSRPTLYELMEKLEIARD